MAPPTPLEWLVAGCGFKTSPLVRTQDGTLLNTHTDQFWTLIWQNLNWVLQWFNGTITSVKVFTTTFNWIAWNLCEISSSPDIWADGVAMLSLADMVLESLRRKGVVSTMELPTKFGNRSYSKEYLQFCLSLECHPALICCWSLSSTCC